MQLKSRSLTFSHFLIPVAHVFDYEVVFRPYFLFISLFVSLWSTFPKNVKKKLNYCLPILAS